MLSLDHAVQSSVFWCTYSRLDGGGWKDIGRLPTLDYWNPSKHFATPVPTPPLPQTAIHCFISSVQIGWFIIWAWCVHDMTPPKIPSWSRISTNWSIFWQDTSFSCGHRSSCSRRAACFLRSLQWYGIQCSVSDISHVFVFCRMYPPACLRPLISAARVA